jgi:hypothetical protein
VLTTPSLPLCFKPSKVANFPRNNQPHFAQYTSERPETASHGEKSKKAKTTKEN